MVAGVIEPIESLAGNIADRFGERCEQPFYSGRVEPPPDPQPAEDRQTVTPGLPTARRE